MDKLDKFNNTFIDLALSWKNIFYFVAGIVVLASILALGSGSKIAVVIIGWAIIVIAAIVMNIVLKEKKSPPKKETAPEEKKYEF
ncbi:MAG: hypothetical protein JRI79_11480 [Deltaproteobacteria bacterium]|nr:hypothetical protein [Deltaproteobacteria bacterium]MBW1936063.1 hypothetical protein [Deltaproteobacteria bacterium]MBW1978569.1 hypothetical protein [Deltaproteobacteria bacterium]MBW2044179.1 hypothetical protein [Deltaproteobacteria bacterium]MBW2300306.1 hypothetical protein [Deltaproteobacteria bacterium]